MKWERWWLAGFDRVGKTGECSLGCAQFEIIADEEEAACTILDLGEEDITSLTPPDAVVSLRTS